MVRGVASAIEQALDWTPRVHMAAALSSVHGTIKMVAMEFGVPCGLPSKPPKRGYLQMGLSKIGKIRLDGGNPRTMRKHCEDS